MFLAFLYLIVTFCLGKVVCQNIVDPKKWLQKNASLSNGEIPNSTLLELALWTTIGVLLMGWITYLFAYWSKSTFTGSVEASFFSIFIILLLEFRSRRKHLKTPTSNSLNWRESIWNILKEIKPIEWITLVIILLSSILLMCGTLSGNRESIRTTNTIASDFYAHISVIRSFSEGNNFPTQYPIFPAASIRYHFMFFFYCAVLETLGLPFAWAVNVFSIAILSSMLILLYAWAVCLVGNRIAGFFAILLTILPPLSPGNLLQRFNSPTPWKDIWHGPTFIGWTIEEGWGLWSSLNIFANQRHITFGISVILISLIATLPAVRALQKAIYQVRWQQLPRQLFFRKECWLSSTEDLSLRTSLFLGFILGLISFWNGNCLITALLVLAWTGLVSYHRMGFLIIALVAIGVANIQTHFFIPEGNAISFTFVPGFLARSHDLRAIVFYYFMILGLALPAAIIATIAIKKITGVYMLSLGWLLPTIFATLYTICIDVAVNHKFVLISYLLFTPAIGWLLATGFRSRPFLTALATLILISPGVALTLVIKNSAFVDQTPPTTKPLRDWVKTHINPKEIVLSPNGSLEDFLACGRKLYTGRPYYSHAAGYPEAAHFEKACTIYQALSAAAVALIAKEENIRFIVITDDIKRNFKVNEFAFCNTPGVLEAVWNTPEKTIYEVK